MRQYELRTYRFKSAAAAEQYGEVWRSHIENLKRLGIQTHGVFAIADESRTVVALVSYPEYADVAKLTAQYMASDDFALSMEPFDKTQFAGVEETILHPLPFSDLR